MSPPRDPVVVDVTRDRLVVRATAGCAPLLGLFFLAVGGAFFYGLSGGFTNLHEIGPLELSVAWVLTMIAAMTGLWVLHTSRGHRAVLDATRRTVVIERRAPFHTARERIRMAEVREAQVTVERDSDGDRVYGLVLVLQGGRRASLSPQFYPDRPPCDRAAAEINRFLAAHR